MWESGKRKARLIYLYAPDRFAWLDDNCGEVIDKVIKDNRYLENKRVIDFEVQILDLAASCSPFINLIELGSFAKGVVISSVSSAYVA